MMPTPRLACIIPLYNHAACVTTMLECICRQTMAQDLELILVNDASTDGSAERVEDWARRTGFSFTLLHNDSHLGPLATWLKGFAASSAPRVLFVEADDRLTETYRLAIALEQSEKSGAEIVHYRSQGRTGSGTCIGELAWSFPPALELSGADIFGRIIRQPHPQFQLWNKIVTRPLVERVLPHIPHVMIHAFADKLLAALICFFATSYKSSEELVYEHTVCDDVRMENYAARIHSLYVILDTLAPLMQSAGACQDSLAAFTAYIRRSLAINAGKLCLKAEPFLRAEPPMADEVFGRITTQVDMELFTQAMILSNGYNAVNISKSIEILFHEF